MGADHCPGCDCHLPGGNLLCPNCGLRLGRLLLRLNQDQKGVVGCSDLALLFTGAFSQCSPCDGACSGQILRTCSINASNDVGCIAQLCTALGLDQLPNMLPGSIARRSASVSACSPIWSANTHESNQRLLMYLQSTHMRDQGLLMSLISP